MAPKQLVLPPGMTAPNAGPSAPPPVAQVNLNPRTLDDVMCEKCNNYTFQDVVLMKRVSPLQSPTGKEAFIPANVFACAACGHVNDRFIQGMLNGWFKDATTSMPAPTPMAVVPPSAPLAPATPTADGIQSSAIPGLESVPTDDA